MTPDAIKQALLASYARDGGINHLDGVNLPSQDSVTEIARDLMHLLFPGFFEDSSLTHAEAPVWLGKLLAKIESRLVTEVEKCLRFAGNTDSPSAAKVITAQFFSSLPEVRRLVQTDVAAAYSGDPAARSTDEIILAYPCVLAISLQRLAHVLYALQVPLLPRMLTEYAHERTGIDIHPGAQIGSHFFIDHGTGVVIGETSIIGANVKLYQGVSLIARSLAGGQALRGKKRHPTVEANVTIYAGTTIMGGDTVVGAGSTIGAGVFLTRSIPPRSLVFYREQELQIVEKNRKNESWDDWAI